MVSNQTRFGEKLSFFASLTGNFTNHYYRQKGRFGFLLQIVMTTKQKHNQEDRRKPGLHFPRIEVDNSLPSNVCVTLQILSHVHC